MIIILPLLALISVAVLFGEGMMLIMAMLALSAVGMLGNMT